MTAPTTDIAVQTMLVRAMGSVSVRQRSMSHAMRLPHLLASGASMDACGSELLAATGSVLDATQLLEEMRGQINDVIDLLIVGVGRQWMEQQGRAPADRRQAQPPPGT